MRIRAIPILTFAILLTMAPFLPASENRRPQAALDPAPAAHNLPPIADAGPDLATYVGLLTRFQGYGASPSERIVRYEWDFDGDGAHDFRSLETGTASHVYDSAGTYRALLSVHDAQGNAATDTVQVIVRTGMGKQEPWPATRLRPEPEPAVKAQGDGIVERYAVMINGGYETRFWNDVTFMYATLTDDYFFAPARIYLLNHDGTNPDGLNPGGMIDDPATLSNLDTVFAELSTLVDSDDELFVWVTDHGNGYSGPQSQYYGYLGGFASVDPGDEQDYLERDFKLRSFCTYGDYFTNHGMDEFKVYYHYSSSQGVYQMYRNKFVSSFSALYFENVGVQSDGDIYIERLFDYLLGDTDRDGYVETAQGEVLDYDGDGNPPYDHATGTFDPDDWGELDDYDDDVTHLNTGVPGDSYIIFDANLDNHVDIDINYDPANLEVDGTDLDNQGLFDGIDVNDDGDMDDWVSIDEMICLAGDGILDDEMAILIDRVNANVISVFMEQCFSGGFIDDLSAPRRVISTATEEETMSWGNLFVGLFTSAFHRATQWGAPVDADEDGNGHISMREAFNYAAENDYFDEIPQYDDNGDGISHPYPIPLGGDGSLGAITYLESFYDPVVIPSADARSGDPGQAITYTLQMTNTGNVTDTLNVTVHGHAWSTVAPGTTGPLGAGAGVAVDVVVNIPPSAMGGAIDTAAITITSQGDPLQSVTSTLTTTANNIYGVQVTPTADGQGGDPGTTVTYTLYVTHTGNVSDRLDVTISGHTWATTAPATVGPLAPGAGTTVDVAVRIPTSAAGGAIDTATVVVTSRGDPAQSSTVTLASTANVVAGVTVRPATDAQSAAPGTTVTYTLQVTNAGNLVDTFDVAVSGQAWSTDAPTTVGPLAAAARAHMAVTVRIPASAADGESDMITISITSRRDETERAMVTLTTTAQSAVPLSYKLFLPLVIKQPAGR